MAKAKNILLKNSCGARNDAMAALVAVSGYGLRELPFLTPQGIRKKIFGKILLARKTRRWIGFSEDDAKGIAEDANITRKAAIPANALRTTRSTRIIDLRDNYFQRLPITCEVGPTDEAEEWDEVWVED